MADLPTYINHIFWKSNDSRRTVAVYGSDQKSMIQNINPQVIDLQEFIPHFPKKFEWAGKDERPLTHVEYHPTHQLTSCARNIAWNYARYLQSKK